jgi:hypothetical protein
MIFGRPIPGGRVLGIFARPERVLSLKLSKGYPPLLLSAKFCGKPEACDSKDNRFTNYIAISAKRPLSTYVSSIKGALSNRKLLLAIQPSNLDGLTHLVKFSSTGSFKIEMPTSFNDGVFAFDPTNSEYLRLLDFLALKRWSNHLLLYYPLSDTVHWQVGWNDYVFQPSLLPAPIVNGVMKWSVAGENGPLFCGHSSRFSYLRIYVSSSQKDFGDLFFDYRKAYDFPWNRIQFRIPFNMLGASITIDIINPNLHQFVRILTGMDSTEFVHITMNLSKSELHLNINGHETFILYRC